MVLTVCVCVWVRAWVCTEPAVTHTHTRAHTHTHALKRKTYLCQVVLISPLEESNKLPLCSLVAIGCYSDGCYYCRCFCTIYRPRSENTTCHFHCEHFRNEVKIHLKQWHNIKRELNIMHQRNHQITRCLSHLAQHNSTQSPEEMLAVNLFLQFYIGSLHDFTTTKGAKHLVFAGLKKKEKPVSNSPEITTDTEISTAWNVSVQFQEVSLQKEKNTWFGCRKHGWRCSHFLSKISSFSLHLPAEEVPTYYQKYFDAKHTAGDVRRSSENQPEISTCFKNVGWSCDHCLLACNSTIIPSHLLMITSMKYTTINWRSCDLHAYTFIPAYAVDPSSSTDVTTIFNLMPASGAWH